MRLGIKIPFLLMFRERISIIIQDSLSFYLLSHPYTQSLSIFKSLSPHARILYHCMLQWPSTADGIISGHCPGMQKGETYHYCKTSPVPKSQQRFKTKGETFGFMNARLASPSMATDASSQLRKEKLSFDALPWHYKPRRSHPRRWRTHRHCLLASSTLTHPPSSWTMMKQQQQSKHTCDGHQWWGPLWCL